MSASVAFPATLPSVEHFFTHPLFAPHAAGWPPKIEGSPRLVSAPLRAQGALAFERAVVERDELWMRPGNAHDAFNALIWRLFPRAKRAISRLHVALGHDPASPNGRSPHRDRLTLFDEAGVLLVARDAQRLALAHARHDWTELFVARRACWHTAIGVIVFGHGALEQIAASFARTGAARIPRTLTLTGLWLEADPSAPLEQLDGLLAEGIASAGLLRPEQPRWPLPLIGVPGWFAESAHPALYEDREVFRPWRGSG
ncbi:MAG: DUF3025 domain-containing protein [Casimicrobiaceae bacterium]|nr:DUF3025 domain-containing protein [Casimicrobiaceae bacterium]MDW8311869.1 DUF3025 domain-containing protein [Burkholderiales bacterium]